MNNIYTEEVWRPVVGYESSYEVSNQGRVRSVARRLTLSDGRVYPLQGRTLKPTLSGRYPSVSLFREGKSVTKTVHLIVLEAFRGPCPPGKEGCHYDDDKENNRLSNLRWASKSDNSRDSVRNGRHPNARKTHCKYGHEFTPENVLARADGKRVCLACRSVRNEKRRNERKRKS